MSTTLSFFADENISTYLINWIRKNGYKISGVKEENIDGTTDISIIKSCHESNKIILTHDNDFGKIIFRINNCKRLIIGHRTAHKLKSE